MKQILTKCRICGEEHIVELTDDEYANYLRWKNRELLIQEALPNRSAIERELLMTGTCNECWNIMFGSEEDEM